MQFPSLNFRSLLASLLFLISLTFLSYSAGTGGWSIFPSADVPPPQSDGLRAITCVSASDCWAVGVQSAANNTAQTLIEHWDGSSWTIVSSPNTSTSVTNALYAVACASTSECWAVGVSYATFDLQQTLILRWNGHSWSVVTSPDVNTTHDNILYSVGCASTSQCWAVGYYNNGVQDLTLIEKWNGSTWKIVASANVTTQYGNYLRGVTCTSTSNCWAAGDYFDTDGFERPLLEQWNGTAWAVVSYPLASGEFHAVTCTGSADCWAAGSFSDNGVDETLIAHWNGSAWSQVPSPNVGPTQYPSLFSLACASATECWAAGRYFHNTGPDYILLLHWNGTSWSLDPGNPLKADIYGLSCTSASQCWAVGSYFNTGSELEQTLIEKYVTPLTASGATRSSTGHFLLDGQAAPNSSVNIEQSPDLITPFQSLGTAQTDANGIFQYDDASETSLQMRFYRASYP